MFNTVYVESGAFQVSMECRKLRQCLVRIYVESGVLTVSGVLVVLVVSDALVVTSIYVVTSVLAFPGVLYCVVSM